MSDSAPAPHHQPLPTEPRWTHVALRVGDIDATIEWYQEFTPLELIEKRSDDSGHAAWLGMPGRTSNPFILVVVQFLDGKDPFADNPTATLAPFAHLGIELPNHADIEATAERGAAADCLVTPPTMLPAPIGYITTLADPDGNMVEFSWDQGVYAALQRKWGED